MHILCDVLWIIFAWASTFNMSVNFCYRCFNRV